LIIYPREARIEKFFLQWRGMITLTNPQFADYVKANTKSISTASPEETDRLFETPKILFSAPQG